MSMNHEEWLKSLSLSERWINNEVKLCMVESKVCSAIVKQFVLKILLARLLQVQPAMTPSNRKILEVPTW